MQIPVPDRETLRRFAVTMGSFLGLLGLLLTLKHKPGGESLFVISCLFFIGALLRTPILKPLYIAWMRLAFALSWINTRLILCLLFYLILTPIGLTMRLLGKDLIEKRIEKDRPTYWKKKEHPAAEMIRYGKQF